MEVWKWAAGLGTVTAAAEYGIAEYFFRRTMLRGNARRDRTQKMAGTTWEVYIPGIRACRAWLMDRQKENVFIRSRDGLKLCGTYFPAEGSDRTFLCFHGYTSEGLNDFPCIAKFYLEMGYNVLLVDERAHGKSEGTYIGFGCLDRWDAVAWIQYLLGRFGQEQEIYLHGMSMGGATVLMTSGLKLPPQVKGIISDCGFTSAWGVFTSVLNHMYHIPAFPILQISDRLAKKRAGYGLAECNSADEVKKATVPILMIHGDADTFVPCWMCDEIYRSCASSKRKLIIKGASHAEAYYKNTAAYEHAVHSFLDMIKQQGGINP
ncbi:alpha/beta hydrolase [Ruminococcus sp. OA3]|nr:alpha/beta hydrolase [Ruminococcus sp. OA3]MCH1983085.1 alpha/beta hydrolase [Ruminococcus sp. OA3]